MMMEVQAMKDLELLQPPRWNILEAQRVLQEALAVKTGLAQHLPAETVGELLERVRFNREALGVEMVELLDHLPWKLWKTYTVQPEEHVSNHADTMTEVKYEAVDALHFLVNIFLALGMSWGEVEAIYYTKHRQNLDRIERGY